MKECKTKISWGTRSPDSIVGAVDRDFYVRFGDWFDFWGKIYRLRLSRLGKIYLDEGNSEILLASIGSIKSRESFKWSFNSDTSKILSEGEVLTLKKKIKNFLTPKRIQFVATARHRRPTRKQRQKAKKRLSTHGEIYEGGSSAQFENKLTMMRKS